MEFASILTFYNNNWKNVLIGPTNLLIPSKRKNVMKYRDTLMIQQNSSCNYCGDAIKLYPSSNCDCDHIIPIVYGGSCEIDNLQLLCVCCHRLKSREERKKKKFIIHTKGTRDGCVYITSSISTNQDVVGTIQSPDFACINTGLYELNIKTGEVNVTRKFVKRPRHIVNTKGAHEYFTGYLTRGQELGFEKNKRGIINLILLSKMDNVFLTRLYHNEDEMNTQSKDFGGIDIQVIGLLKKCLDLCGTNGIFDFKKQMDFAENGEELNVILDKIELISGEKSMSNGVKYRLSYHLEKWCGVTILRRRVWVKKLGKKTSCYHLDILHPEWLDFCTKLGSHIWVKEKFEQYDRYRRIPIGSEFRFNKARRTIVEFCNRWMLWKYSGFPFSKEVLRTLQ